MKLIIAATHELKLYLSEFESFLFDLLEAVLPRRRRITFPAITLALLLFVVLLVEVDYRL